MEDKKLTKLEKYWVLYDVGNSAFVMLVSAILPLYFASLAEGAGLSEVDYLAYWGYAISVSTIITAVGGPILGAIADTKNFKKKLFAASVLLGTAFCVMLCIPKMWAAFLVLFILSKACHNASLVFYDSMLTDVTTQERLDRVSANGYAWGYIGSCVPFLISIILILGHDRLGIPMTAAMACVFFLNAAWWIGMSVPIFCAYRQKYYVDMPEHPVRESGKRLFNTLSEMGKQKKVFLFLLSFFFFIDGVYTVIDMAAVYGSAVGLDSSGLLLALLLTQIVAFPCALVFSRFSEKYKTETLLRVCIIAYFFIALFAIQMDQQWKFWLLAVLVGMFMGAIQALSRSYFAKIIPAEKSGEYFGIYDICGKGASFMGTILVGVIAQITGRTSCGVGAIAVMFLIGYMIFDKAEKA